jgi:hypothetical protein
LSTAYHPQTDGQTERVNQELEQYLRLYTNFMQTDWYDWLAPAEFAYNNRVHSSTGYSPFYLEYGRHPHIPGVPTKKTNNPAAEGFHVSLKEAREMAATALQKTADNMKRFADRNRRKSPDYKVGDLVWLDLRNVKTGRPTKKLDARRTGPFKITAQVGPVAYRLQLPRSWKLHNTFHVSLLSPAHIDKELHPDEVDDALRPPPDIVDGEEEYEVERVLEHKGNKRKRSYLIKWKNYPISEATWEPKKNLKHAKDLVLAYEDGLREEQ